MTRAAALFSGTCLSLSLYHLLMMTCEAFLDGFSDYLDGCLPDDRSEGFESHLEACGDCRQYRDVMLRSLELVRALDPPTPSAGFGDRLNARLYAEDKMNLATGPLGSGTTSGTTVVITLLFAAAAWSPTMNGRSLEADGPVEDSVASVDVAPPSVTSAGPTGLGSFSAGQITLHQTEEFEEDLWSYPNAVFYAYSSLSKRRRGRTADQAIQTVGLQ